MKLVNEVIARIDFENAQDPKVELVDGREVAKELVYGQRMSSCLEDYFEESSDLLKIAVRAQHIRRWDIARSDYPMERSGYLRWRKDLGQYHGEFTAKIMQEIGVDEDSCLRVSQILKKTKIKSDPEVQTLEDVACLVFLKHYFDDFCKKHTEEKLNRIVQKTWAKMSEQGHAIALQLGLSDEHMQIITKALTVN